MKGTVTLLDVTVPTDPKFAILGSTKCLLALVFTVCLYSGCVCNQIGDLDGISKENEAQDVQEIFRKKRSPFPP